MQINRLLEIVYILLEKQKVTAEELADRFSVSTRTIYRDIETLSLASVPVYMSKGKNGGISILPEYTVNKTYLTDQEKQDIIASIGAVENLLPRDNAAAIVKLKSFFGGAQREWIEVDFSNWSDELGQNKIFNEIKSAILNFESIKISYFGSDGSSVRTVEPLKLCFKGQAWYLYAYCTLRNDNRFFKLTRIKNIEPSGVRVAHTAPQSVLGDLTEFKDEFIDIKLKISSALAYRVYDEFQNFKTDSNGDFIVSARVPKGKWLLGYISSLGASCEVLDPLAVRNEIRENLEKTLKKYQ